MTDFTSNSQATSPLLTGLVLGLPTPPGAADLLLPGVPVPNIAFEYLQYDTGHLVIKNAERPMKAPIGTATMTGSRVSAALRRYTMAGDCDVAELDSASAPGGDPMFRAHKANVGRALVNQAREKLTADLLTATGTYASGHSTTLAGGSEWDSSGGDSLLDIMTAADAILAATGRGLETLRVFLSGASYMAALKDPNFRATRGNSTWTQATASDLAAYWGVERVDVRNPIYTTGGVDDAPTAMYGDTAIVYAPTDPVGFDRFAGTKTFGVTFQWNAGVALQPFMDNLHTTWYFPWEHWIKPAVLSNTAGYLIKNTAA